MVPANGWSTGDADSAGERQRGRRQALQLLESVRSDGRPTGRQTTLHLPGSRRRANGQVAALDGDKRAVTVQSDGQVLSLFRRQSDGVVGKTVRQ